jgi:hypothetical protein
MKGAAERPVEPGASVEEGRGRAPESASFATTRVGAGRGGRPPLFIVGFIGLLGAVVAFGVGGKPEPASNPPVAVGVTASPSPSPTPNGTVCLCGVSRGQVVEVWPAPAVTSKPGPVQIDARRSSGKVFVHGDVFVPRVSWVFVSLLDDAGRVAGWASVSVPGAAGPAQSGGPSLRFDVELAITDEFPGRLWLSANAYDADGNLVSSSRLELVAPTFIVVPGFTAVPTSPGLAHPPPRGPRPSFGS